MLAHVPPSMTRKINTMQVMMWMDGSRVTSVKDPRGLDPDNRPPGHTAVVNAAPHALAVNGLYSFIIAILPFFKPTAKQLTALQNATCTLGTDAKKYVEILRNGSPLFSAVAHYVFIVGFMVQSHLVRALRELAAAFQNGKGLLMTGNEHQMSKFQEDVQSFMPEVKVKRRDGTIGRLTKEQAKELAEQVVNTAIIQLVRTINEDFDVTSLICQTDYVGGN